MVQHNGAGLFVWFTADACSCSDDHSWYIFRLINGGLFFIASSQLIQAAFSFSFFLSWSRLHCFSYHSIVYMLCLPLYHIHGHVHYPFLFHFIMCVSSAAPPACHFSYTPRIIPAQPETRTNAVQRLELLPFAGSR